MIGERIRKLRTDLDLSGKRLADMVGVTQSYISAIERGEREPSVDVLKSLANALQTSVSYLIDEEGDHMRTNNQQNPSNERGNDFVSVRADSLDNVDKTVVLLRSVIRDKDQLPPEDKEILRKIMEHGIQALKDDPRAKRIV